jgi:hypothetical protein
MKIEPRGKYSGAKCHLDADECTILIGGEKEHQKKLLKKLSKKLIEIFDDNPTMLGERTEEEIRAELELELKKAQEKLDKMNSGTKWNK